ncbi:Methyltransferase domain-containing protein [Marivirga sericea]|uniref:Methyltransferase domain-containing protein n=1 Tax=Marivirga sericea TaxID=1028 RepID=A0A1X7KM47_9BACT|nr:methyltransferase domain-containing protein [Marivirga sericea]SMG42239.1 Methyltransferase domain-containing protein [Marivirga sericea]
MNIKLLPDFLKNHFQYWMNIILKQKRTFYKDQHQLTSTTKYNRYPKIFSAMQEYVTRHWPEQEIKILSYGCSEGEECFSVNEYLKESSILGVDINKSNLLKAKKKNDTKNIKFAESTHSNIETGGKYHAILCMSVLCRWEDTKDMNNCEKIYPFRKFEETVSFLSDQLLENGILIIYNSNFMFEQTEVGKEFKILDVKGEDNSGNVHKFDKKNERYTSSHKAIIYQKL